MAVDIQVCFPQETITVSGITAIPGDLRIIEVRGEDFSAVDSIRVNDQEVKDFAVLSSTFLRAQLPSNMRPSEVETVTVVSRRLALTSRSLLRFRMSKMPSKVSGILRLVQLYVKVLLTDPGSDSFNQNLGGGLLRNIGNAFPSAAARGGIVNDAAIAVRRTNEQIIAIQARQPSIPANEKLLSASIQSSSFSPSEAALSIELDLRSQTGEPAILNLVY